MIISKSAPETNNAANLEMSMFLQDITLLYSIDLDLLDNRNTFYSVVPSEDESMLKYAYDGYRDFLRYGLDNLLTQITHELVIKGESFVVLVENIQDESLQSWHLQVMPWQSYRINKNTIFIKQVINQITRTETFDNHKVLHFSLNDIGLSTAVFRKAMKRVERTSLLYSHKLTPFNKNYDFMAHDKASNLEFLSATKHIFWSGRKYSNPYTSEPYILYKRSKWLQLRLKILKYLIEKVNRFLNNYGKQYGLYGEIQFKSCYSSTQIAELWEQYSSGKTSTAELREYLFRYK